MDRYERLLLDIREKTEGDLLRWEVVKSDPDSGIILNPDRVHRSFAADFRTGGTTYRLLFVEGNHDRVDESRDSRYKLHILDVDGRPVISLYDGLVDRHDLLRLWGLIEGHNETAKAFFAAFESDQSGAA